jgi:Cu(I)/Ag(I) efflux system periplasmic protein CusF
LKTIYAVVAAIAMSLAAALALPAAAQMSHAHGAMATQMAPSMGSVTGAGEVRKIEVDKARVTLKHDAMKETGMPAMTMVYPVADASLLRSIKVGDKVRFQAASAGGKTTITEIQATQ